MDIITTHKNADFDAVASMVAATLLYPGAVPVRPNDLNPNVKAFLSIHKDIFDTYLPKEAELDKVRRLIVVDTGSWARLDGHLRRLQKNKDLELILWDHHPEGDMQAQWTCREFMGATVTLLVRRLREQGMRLTPMQATLFLLGLYEDTGNLSFSSTKSEDALAAAYLLENRADLNVLSTFLRPVYGERQKEILFDMIQAGESAKVDVKGHRIAVSRMVIEGHVGNLSVVINMYREIMNVDAAFGVFTDLERQRTFVIGRSKTEDLNVGSIMRSLGGGGHPAAGSAMLDMVNPDAVVDQIMTLLEGNQQSSVQLSDLMSYPVTTVEASMPMERVWEVLEEKGCTGLPVVEDGVLTGVISRRDFRKIRKEAQKKSPVKAFMSRNIITIDPEKSPMEAAKVMVKHDIGRLPVIRDGKIIGIVSRSDAMRYFYDLLPD
ncbi:nanoRNase/pAp phosphatase (c-di-AMP/oligoRNAs hydrolase) [Desulfobotulus alkaliphilus]|uniref:NanoRNase/pAp phosphatase (C-di-AMP/oligoRNAs hydrolase) n=1 Tax=Desulfobotulus alkaliphilus TaxID=622671 RepID=A0A562RPX2_9BACT|nr:CBS domain-containing protein [Desulfobotulus alkaliphilus]TWI71099.1 nanoRNase/pAp phosphatase (c-di-AMP/oligoRNAs hydrolase) [Desulfobotulus alkaliphilus]